MTQKCKYCGAKKKVELNFLITSKKYYDVSKQKLRAICNGTGAKGTPKWIISFLDNLWGFGFDYTEASNRHDVMYEFGKSARDKIIADIVYFINLFILFSYYFVRTFFYVLFLIINLLRVFVYPLAVLLLGWKAFNKNK